MGTLVKPIEYLSQDILSFVFPSNQIPSWTVISTDPPNETISVPEYTDKELSDGYTAYLAYLLDQMKQEQIEQQEEADQLLATLQQASQTPSLGPKLISKAGRLYLRRNQWTTGADDQYGYGYFQNSENAGSGSTPILEWEHMGVYLPAGRKLGDLHMVGRTNSTSITDIDMYAVLRFPDTPDRWGTGIDNDNEMDSVVLHNDRFATPVVGDAFAGGNMADMRRRIVSLNHVLEQDAFFGIYMRPVTTSNNTRYFYHTWTLEVY